ncbi:MAG: orotate phosphoribosyltransferase, partial [Chromatiales bacterium]|nr:orotate phosphoribosyltransferase [Chromatiales bacterium]
MTTQPETIHAEAIQVDAHDELGLLAAKVLLDTGAVLFRPDRPFFFSSGWASPVYVDCAKAISYPMARDALIELSIRRIQSVVGYAALDGIAGAEGGGVPFAAIIADRLHLPLVIARKQSAGLGPHAQTDGEIAPGNRMLLVDDVTTDGRTKASMSEALRKAEAAVRFAFVIFRYGIFDAVMRQEDLGVELFSLLTWRELLAVAHRERAFAPDIIDKIEDYVA